MSDTMLLGVLRMPFDLAMATPTSRIQYHQRGVQAADEIEKMSAEIARLHKAHQVACEGGDLLRATLLAEVERLTREHDEARAEVERLREALVLASEALASHQGSPGREWHNAGAWLYPGDSINVVRAPLPEIKVES